MSEKSEKSAPKDSLLEKMKFKHGTGIMYFANGDQLNGEWCYDQCKRGTYKFAYGDIFEGEISESSIQNGKMIFFFRPWNDDICLRGRYYAGI